jgi:hypothetical protein
MYTKKNANPCPYNEGVGCDTPNCEHCGWYPPEAKRRMKGIMGEQKKYTVPITGYCEVWANSPEEAVEKADNDEMFFVHYDFGDPTCEEEDEDETVCRD